MMARHYSLKSFLRQMPKDLLARFFHSRDLFSDIPLKDLAKKNTNHCFELIQTLSDEQRNPLDNCCQVIFDLCCEKGVLVIIDTIKTQHANDNEEISDQLIQQLSTLKSHYHKVMFIYLDHRRYWPEATFLYHADTRCYWQKRKDMGHKPADTAPETLQALALAIGEYFNIIDAKGKNCQVDHVKRDVRDYFFVYAEDYATRLQAWKKIS